LFVVSQQIMGKLDPRNGNTLATFTISTSWTKLTSLTIKPTGSTGIIGAGSNNRAYLLIFDTGSNAVSV
jgi:hypothetical protein